MKCKPNLLFFSMTSGENKTPKGKLSAWANRSIKGEPL
jgi:hypothetical protein